MVLNILLSGLQHYFIPFIFSLIAILIGNIIWRLLTGPRLIVKIYDTKSVNFHSITKIKYYKIGVSNDGNTAAEECSVYVNIKRKGYDDRDYVPKWDAIPEPVNNFYQKITISPKRIHEETIPILIMPKFNIQGSNNPGYIAGHLYIFSAYYNHLDLPKDQLEVPQGEYNGYLGIGCKNYYCKFDLTVKFNGNYPEIELKPQRVNLFLFRKPKVEK